MKTIKKTIQTETVINKSKFICHLKRVKSIDEATAYINLIKKEHWNANHNCSAFIIGHNQDAKRSSDDGEPSGTAGAPMLNSLSKNNLSNIVSVVTRYFGGVKLGAGGLIRAYGGAVSGAIANAIIIDVVKMNVVRFGLDYSQANTIINKLDDYLLQDKLFLENVTLTYLIRPENITAFEARLTDLANKEISLSIVETIDYDLPVEK